MVERALRQQLAWELKRLDGIRAIEEYYEEHGYPTPEEMAEAEARVAEEHRLIDEARAYKAARQRLPVSQRWMTSREGLRLRQWGAHRHRPQPR